MGNDINFTLFLMALPVLGNGNACLMKFKCNLKMKNSCIEKNASCTFREVLQTDFTKTTASDFTREPRHGAWRGR